MWSNPFGSWANAYVRHRYHCNGLGAVIPANIISSKIDPQKEELFKEIAEKAEKKKKRDEAIAEGKKEFDAKKPQLFKEIAEKAKKWSGIK